MASQKPRMPREPSLSPRKPIARVQRGRGPGPASLGRRVAYAALTLAIVAVGAFAATMIWFGRDLPPVDALRHYEPPQTTRILDRNGEVLGELFRERRTVVPLERVPRLLVVSVLAAEDADFYRHTGFDYAGIARALLRMATTGRVTQGGSTITQQLVKLMLLTPERTVRRKIRELILARRLEQELTKDEILHLYLNHINFGHGRYGVQEASRYYFGKNVEALTLAEAALLAGLPQAPGRLSPRRNPDLALERRGFVLDQLEAKRAEYWPDVTPGMIRTARETPIALVPVEATSHAAPEVVAEARRALQEAVGEEAYRRGGFVVRTTIDLALQRAAREALTDQLDRIDRRHRYRGPLVRERRRARARRETKRQVAPPPEPDGPRAPLSMGRTYEAEVTRTDDTAGTLELDVEGHRVLVPLRDEARANPDGLPPSRFAFEGAKVPVSIVRLPGDRDEDDGDAETEGSPAVARLELGPEGAALVVDVEHREILAMVGGYRAAPGFNRALRALRQPGSTFKPLVYAAAIRSRRFTPATIVLDAPRLYDEWEPRNYEPWRHEGPIRLREALARSINLVAVRVTESVGPKAVADLARELGIEADLREDLAIGLGASEVTLAGLVGAYASFADAGRWRPLRLVRSIEDGAGAPVPLEAPAPPRDVLTAEEAYVVTSLLESVVEDGTGRYARRLRRPVAGKTGTSNEARDAWFVGYTPEVAAGVWIGFDDRRPLGRRESGGRSALPAWVGVMRAAVKGSDAAPFPRPAGVVTASIDPETGLLAPDPERGLREVFLPGTVPTETARRADVADPTTFFLEQFDEGAGGGAR